MSENLFVPLLLLILLLILLRRVSHLSSRSLLFRLMHNAYFFNYSDLCPSLLLLLQFAVSLPILISLKIPGPHQSRFCSLLQHESRLSQFLEHPYLDGAYAADGVIYQRVFDPGARHTESGRMASPRESAKMVSHTAGLLLFATKLNWFISRKRSWCGLWQIDIATRVLS